MEARLASLQPQQRQQYMALVQEQASLSQVGGLPKFSLFIPSPPTFFAYTRSASMERCDRIHLFWLPSFQYL